MMGVQLGWYLDVPHRGIPVLAAAAAQDARRFHLHTHVREERRPTGVCGCLSFLTCLYSFQLFVLFH